MWNLNVITLIKKYKMRSHLDKKLVKEQMLPIRCIVNYKKQMWRWLKYEVIMLLLVKEYRVCKSFISLYWSVVNPVTQICFIFGNSTACVYILYVCVTGNVNIGGNESRLNMKCI